MLSRHGSKRYNVAKNEVTWMKKNYGKFFSTPQIVINNGQHMYRRKAQQRFLTILPTVTAIIPAVSLVVCYIMALKRDDMPSLPYVPFAGELGRKFPDQCVFVLGLCTSSFLIITLSYLRFKQLSLIYKGFINKLSLIFGVTSAWTLLFVVAVKTSDDLVLNYVANGSYICSSVLYVTLQTFLTRKTPTISSRGLCLTRLVLTELVIVLALIFVVFLHPDLAYRNRPPYNIAQAASWFLLTSIQLYTLTFTVDMNQVYFSFDLWVIPTHNNKHFTHAQMLNSIGDDEGTVITTMTSDDNDDNVCMLRTEV